MAAWKKCFMLNVFLVIRQLPWMALLFPHWFELCHLALWSVSNRSTWCLTYACSHSLHSLHTWTLQHVLIESPMSCLQREQERGFYTEDKMNHSTGHCQVGHKEEPTASVFAKLPKHFPEPLNSPLAESAKGYKPLKSLQSAWQLLKDTWDSGMIYRSLVFLYNLGREGKHNLQTSNKSG